MRTLNIQPFEADQVRGHLEHAFLDRFFASEMPPRLTLGLNTELRRDLRQMLLSRDFSEETLDRAMHLYDARVTASNARQDDGWEAHGDLAGMQGRESVTDVDSEFSWRGEARPEGADVDRMMKLLFHIAEDQARQDGYVHRGVSCSSCNVYPLRGIRYRCLNCADFDLCETCEAQQIHIKTHVFIKIRIPTTSLGNPKLEQAVWYPGKASNLFTVLPRSLCKTFEQDTGFEKAEVEAMWEQFQVTAASEWPGDPNGLGCAIDRKTFNRCLAPSNAPRPPPANLIYDRLFAFYDGNGDGLIGFEEYIRGIACVQNRDREDRLQRIFRGYDIDGDGYVSRRDFLRIFRAYYVLSRERAKDVVASMEDDSMDTVNVRQIISGSQPISSAFAASVPRAQPATNTGEGKEVDEHGDLQIADGAGVTVERRRASIDRHGIIADAAERLAFPLGPASSPPSRPSYTDQPRRPEAPARTSERERVDGSGSERAGPDEDQASETESEIEFARGMLAEGEDQSWPPHLMQAEDVAVIKGLSADGSWEDVKRMLIATKRRADEDQRKRRQARLQAVKERWRRREFYLDEEEGAVAPPGYEDSEGEADAHSAADDDGHLAGQAKHHQSTSATNAAHVASPRSRSSSKVRFEDDGEDTDYDLRSNPSTSSRSIPVGERWGGYEIPEAEKDAGREMLYQLTQQGFNEMLDPLFQMREGLSMKVMRTREDRRRCRAGCPRARVSREARASSQTRATTEPDVEAIQRRHSYPARLQQAGRDDETPPVERRSSGKTGKAEDGGSQSGSSLDYTAHQRARLGLLDYAEEDDVRRGGPGRIDLDEFKRAMRSSDKHWDFLGAWIETMSF